MRLMMTPHDDLDDEEDDAPSVKFEVFRGHVPGDKEAPPGIIGDVFVRTEKFIAAATAVIPLEADDGTTVPHDAVMAAAANLTHVLWDYLRSQLVGPLAAAGYDASDLPAKTPKAVVHEVNCDDHCSS